MANKASIITLADAVVTALNDQKWTIAFKSARRILPLKELSELQNLEVSVIAGGMEWELISRGSSRIEDSIVDIGFQKHLGSESLPPDFEVEVPPLMLLVEEIGRYFAVAANRHVAGYVLSRIDFPALYGIVELREQNTFMSVMRLTFKRGA